MLTLGREGRASPRLQWGAIGSSGSGEASRALKCACGCGNFCSGVVLATILVHPPHLARQYLDLFSLGTHVRLPPPLRAHLNCNHAVRDL